MMPFYLCHLSFWKWCKIKNTSGYRLTQKKTPIKKNVYNTL
ncbi:hypothetical protein HMPREF1625_00628 [Staphylococcus aureus 880]|nr:hypothetical protein HMPREF1625_00628 [Staphylococcus aureus 880]KXA39111.1 hypothetical protein HMPREF3211_00386 [Staphylococcus aureus]